MNETAIDMGDLIQMDLRRVMGRMHRKLKRREVKIPFGPTKFSNRDHARITYVKFVRRLTEHFEEMRFYCLHSDWIIEENPLLGLDKRAWLHVCFIQI